jgi:hypothetical protein
MARVARLCHAAGVFSDVCAGVASKFCCSTNPLLEFDSESRHPRYVKPAEIAVCLSIMTPFQSFFALVLFWCRLNLVEERPRYREPPVTGA